MSYDATDIVVIGAGIQGLSVAAHLIKQGVRNVVVLERGKGKILPLTNSATDRSAAMIMMQAHNLDQKKVELSLASYPEYLAFDQEFGRKLDFHRCGSVLYTTKSELAEGLRRLVGTEREYGIQAQIVTDSELHDLVPFLFVDDIAAAVYCPMDGYVNQVDVVQGYRDYIVHNGGNIFMDSRVLEIKQHKRKVVAIRTNKEEIPTETVINAAGPFASLIGTLVGIDIPLEATTRTLWFATPKNDISAMPILEDIYSEWYLRPTFPRDILIGVGFQDAIIGELDDERNFEAKHKDEANDYLSTRTPGLVDAHVGLGWAGIRDLTPDKLPILGPVDGVSGFLNCCGWSGYGIMQAPIGGKLLANYVSQNERRLEFEHNGKSFEINLDDFALSRFPNVTDYFQP